MNRSVVLRLMVKDWYLNRVTLGVVAVVGALSVGAMYLRSDLISLMAMSAALITTIFLGILVPMQSVVSERKRQNLAFVMSLPISPAEYTTAKILSNLAAFTVLWLAIVLGVIGTIAGAGTFGGFIPLAFIVALAPFVAFCLLLAVAIVTESEGWSAATMAACNVSYSFAWFFLVRVPGIRADLKSPVPVWSEPMLSILAVESAVIVLAIGLTFYFQSRKTDFI